MALQKQQASFNFIKGVDTKTDEYQVSGKLAVLENGVFQTTGAVRKRNGYEEIGLNAGLAAGNSIAGFNNEVITLDGQQVYSYSNEQDSFISKGKKIAVDVQSIPIVKNNYAQITPYEAYHSSGLKFFVWKDSFGANLGELSAFFYSVFDEATGNAIVNSQFLCGSATPIGAYTLGNFFVFAYIFTDAITLVSELRYIKIPTATPQTSVAAVTLATDLYSTGGIAAVKGGTSLYFVYGRDVTGTNTLAVFSLNSSFVQSAVTNLTGAISLKVDIAYDATNSRLWIGWYDETAYLKYQIITTAFASVLGATNIQLTYDSPTNMAMFVNNNAGKLYYQLTVQPQANVTNTVDVIYKCDLGVAVPGTPALFIRDAGLYSKPFYYNSKIWFIILHQSYEQASYFLINEDNYVASRFLPNLGGPSQYNTLNTVVSLSTNKFSVPLIRRDSTTSLDGIIRFDVGVTEEIFTFNETILNQQIANNLHFSGGILSMYDGINVCEHGFFLYPENVGVTALPYGGTLASGSYQYKVTYDWTDNQGNLHQSAPSVGNTVITDNLIRFTGDTTSGSAVIKNCVFNQFGIMPGMAISGTNIPANAYITDYTPTSVTISANATGTGSNLVFFGDAQDKKTFTANPSSNSLTFDRTIANAEYFYVLGTCKYNETTMTVNDASKLKVGYILKWKNHTVTNGIVGYRAQMAAISGNKVTLTNYLESVNLDDMVSYGNIRPLVAFSATTGVGGAITYTQSPGGNVGYIWYNGSPTTPTIITTVQNIFTPGGIDYPLPTGWSLSYPYLGYQGEVPFGVGPAIDYYVITDISGNEITVDNPFQFSATNQFIDVCFRTAANTTINNTFFNVTTFDGVSWPELPDSLKAGDVVYSTAFTPNYVTVAYVDAVISPYSYNVHFSGGVTNATGGTTVQKVFSADHYVQVGNTITGSPLTGTALVTSVQPEFNKIVLDQDVNTSGSGTFTIANLYSVKLDLPTLRITNKPSFEIIISVWRTLVDQTNFQRVTTFENPIYNETSADYISFTDLISDTVLDGNDYLYTTGGVLENICIPPVKTLVSYKNRLLGVLEEESYTMWYSKPAFSNIPAQFTDLFTINIDQKGGPITGLSVMDDKLIIFKRSMIFYMVGDGPTNTGAANDFSNPTLVTTDSGCNNPKSIVTTPVGVIYKSDKGIYILERSLDVKYIGADVEGYNSTTITSANLVANYNHVRFTLNTGITLMYDYYVQQWSVFKNYDAIDAAIVGFGTTSPVYYMIKSDGTVNKETNGQFLDNGDYIPLKIETNWISMSGLQGFQRIYKVLVLGHYKSPHELTFKSYFDFDSTVQQTTTITIDSDPGVYQYRIFLDRQKGETIKFSLEDSELASLGEGFYLSAIAFEVGIKKGLNKMPSAASYG